MRYRILCVDDETANLRLLERLFRDHYEVVTAPSGAEALEQLKVHDCAVIISDQRMSGMSGIEFLKQAAEMRKQTVRMMLTGYTDAEALVEAVNSGVVYKYITKPWINDDLLATVKRALQHYETTKAQRGLQLQNERLQARLKQTVAAFVENVLATLDLKDRTARAHAERTRGIAETLARTLKLEHEEIETVGLMALLHEFPLLRVPSPIVQKTDAPGPEDQRVIERYFESGISAIENVPDLENVGSMLRYHFERFDGRGFPMGFEREQIPLAARIVTAADAYDSLLHPRGEQQPLDVSAAFGELRRRAPGQLDPTVVDALERDTSSAETAVEEFELVIA